MKNVKEITVSKKETQDLVVHIFVENGEIKMICSNDYEVAFTTKNPSPGKDEFSID